MAVDFEPKNHENRKQTRKHYTLPKHELLNGSRVSGYTLSCQNSPESKQKKRRKSDAQTILNKKPGDGPTRLCLFAVKEAQHTLPLL